MVQQRIENIVADFASIIDKTPENVCWKGEAPRNLLDNLRELPLELPKNGSYLLFTQGDKTLYIAETVADGVSKFRLDGNSSERTSIEVTDQGILISGIRSRLFDRIMLLAKRLKLPADAVSIAHIDVPVDLLDQYSELRAASKTRPLTETERRQSSELLKKIRREFERESESRSSSRSRSTSESYRSTPSSSGESRGGSPHSGG